MTSVIQVHAANIEVTLNAFEDCFNEETLYMYVIC